MIFSVALFVLLIDAFTKFIILRTLVPGQSIKVIPGIFHITFVANTGSAFGLFKGQNSFLIAVAGCVIVLLVFFIGRNRIAGRATSMAVGLILGGAAGNLIDRIRLGRVIDFLDFRVWPVFNIADSAITLGMVILAWAILVQKSKPYHVSRPR